MEEKFEYLTKKYQELHSWYREHSPEMLAYIEDQQALLERQRAAYYTQKQAH